MSDENKQILKLDASQISQYLTCPLSWYYKYHENLRLGTQVRKAAPDKGTLIHKLLERFYLNIAAGNSRNKAGRIALDAFNDENWAKDYNLEQEAPFLKGRFMNYVFHYDESDFTILKSGDEVAGIEVGFSKILYEDETKIFIVEGKIDGITEINQAAAWIDHKTQSRTYDLYPYSPQFLTYTWATGLSWGILNYIALHETYDPKKTFRRKITMYPKHMIDSWEKRMLDIFTQINIRLQWGDQWPANGVDDLFYKIRNQESCAGKYFTPCQFTQLCEIDFTAKQLLETIKSSQYVRVEKWSPWHQPQAGEENGG